MEILRFAQDDKHAIKYTIFESIILIKEFPGALPRGKRGKFENRWFSSFVGKV
jgi:hypothetical protein